MKSLEEANSNRKFSRKGLIIFCIIVFAFLTLAYLIRPLGEPDIVTSNGHSEALGNDQILVQPLTVLNQISSISFRIGTFMQKYDDAILQVQIIEPTTKEIIQTDTFDSSALVDNSTLFINTNLEKGDYLLSFDLDDLGEGQGMVFYTTTQAGDNCSIDGRTRDYSVYLTTERYYDNGYLKKLGISIVIAIILTVSCCLLVHNFILIRKKVITDRKKNTLQIVLAIVCMTVAMILLVSEYVKMIDSRTVSFMKNNRFLFYIIVLLIACFEWLVVKDHFPIGCLLLILLSIVWIFTDLEYSVIDEGAHTGIVQYILKNNYSYPTVQQNYEAVQGPIYYYVIALLFGWMPMQSLYIGGRIFGLIMLILLGWLTKKTISILCEAGIVKVSERIIYIFILLFIFNPNIMIRLTRLSNESLMSVLTAIVVFEFTKMIINGYDHNKLFVISVLCAITFLTKATSVFIFGLVFLICAYNKDWIGFLKQVLVYLLIVTPWFISNYIRYGALTGMKLHMDFVLPILNPERIKPDIWHDVLYYFYDYFLNRESGRWYEYSALEDFMRTVSFVLLCVSVTVSISILLCCIKNKLKFKYTQSEKREVLFMSYTALPVVLIVMHAIQSLTTYINTLAANRHCFLLNIVFCIMYMLGLSKLSDRSQRYIEVIVCLLFAFVTTSMICGYTQIGVSGIL